MDPTRDRMLIDCTSMPGSPLHPPLVVQVAIASFGEFNEDALLSGKDLIRKYPDTAFGESKSKDMFPEHVVKFWHPESKGKDPKKIGKHSHIAVILKDLPQRVKTSEICLLR